MKEWITGRNPVYEVLQARRRQVYRMLVATGVQEKGRLEASLRLAAAQKVPVERVPRQRIDPMGENPQGVALEVGEYPYADIEDIFQVAEQRGEPLFVLLLDLIQNPQNLGTLLRSSEAFGVHGVILPFRHSASITPAVVTASAGASEHLNVAQVNLAQAMTRLKEAGVWIVGLEGSPAAQPPERIRLDGPLALVVGNEGEGMRDLVRKSCDLLMQLPMTGHIDSLNAAVAGSIALYLAVQARREAALK
ncbi:MAG TPA: 23S rRNA (guanosine(2251)-2'-O)-methyltransferase RlmB [Anaerolineaceae bacterium]|nr:23S rRNA (guanosine(2251)-2'-O)-methyltransferase RlmB [Anaerolineaceae bacterium]